MPDYISTSEFHAMDEAVDLRLKRIMKYSDSRRRCQECMDLVQLFDYQLVGAAGENTVIEGASMTKTGEYIAIRCVFGAEESHRTCKGNLNWIKESPFSILEEMVSAFYEKLAV